MRFDRVYMTVTVQRMKALLCFKDHNDRSLPLMLSWMTAGEDAFIHHMLINYQRVETDGISDAN